MKDWVLQENNNSDPENKNTTKTQRKIVRKR